jgi:hypothetical protein
MAKSIGIIFGKDGKPKPVEQKAEKQPKTEEAPKAEAKEKGA